MACGKLILKPLGPISGIKLVTLSKNIQLSLSLPRIINLPGTGPCPIIYDIDGGDPSDDTQFTPINGLLNGGTP